MLRNDFVTSSSGGQESLGLEPDTSYTVKDSKCRLFNHDGCQVAWACVCAAYLLVTLATETEALRRSQDDMDAVLVNLCVMQIVVMSVVKALYLLNKRRPLANLLTTLKSGFPVDDRPSDIQVMMRAAFRARTLTASFGAMSVVMSCVFQFTPLAEMWIKDRRASAIGLAAAEDAHARNATTPEPALPSPRLLPMIAWYPFDIQNDMFLYSVVYVLQLIASFIYVFVHIGIDTFYISYIIYISAHFEVVASRFRDLQKDSLELLKGRNNEKRKSRRGTYDANFAPGNVQEAMYYLLAENVKYHQKVIKFVLDYEKLISPIMLGQFLYSTGILCISGFQATVGANDFTQLLKYLAYLGTATFQLLVFCWFGQILMNESMQVHHAAYHNDWPDAPPRVKRALCIVMLRAQRPTKISTPIVYDLSLETFTRVLNASYSIFAVLRQVHEKQ